MIIYIEYPNKTTEMIRVLSRKFCHNYNAEKRQSRWQSRDL
jgi:hypothetical protein